jgi:hypothetical protein
MNDGAMKSPGIVQGAGGGASGGKPGMPVGCGQGIAPGCIGMGGIGIGNSGAFAACHGAAGKP